MESEAPKRRLVAHLIARPFEMTATFFTNQRAYIQGLKEHRSCFCRLMKIFRRITLLYAILKTFSGTCALHCLALFSRRLGQVVSISVSDGCFLCRKERCVTTMSKRVSGRCEWSLCKDSRTKSNSQIFGNKAPVIPFLDKRMIISGKADEGSEGR